MERDSHLPVRDGLTIYYEDVSKLAETEERLHFAFHDNPMPLVVVEFTSGGGTISEANAALEDMLGYGRGELVGLDVTAFVHGDDAFGGEHGGIVEPRGRRERPRAVSTRAAVTATGIGSRSR